MKCKTYTHFHLISNTYSADSTCWCILIYFQRFIYCCIFVITSSGSSAAGRCTVISNNGRIINISSSSIIYIIIGIFMIFLIWVFYIKTKRQNIQMALQQIVMGIYILSTYHHTLYYYLIPHYGSCSAMLCLNFHFTE